MYLGGCRWRKNPSQYSTLGRGAQPGSVNVVSTTTVSAQFRPSFTPSPSPRPSSCRHAAQPIPPAATHANSTSYAPQRGTEGSQSARSPRPSGSGSYRRGRASTSRASAVAWAWTLPFSILTPGNRSLAPSSRTAFDNRRLPEQPPARCHSADSPLSESGPFCPLRSSR